MQKLHAGSVSRFLRCTAPRTPHNKLQQHGHGQGEHGWLTNVYRAWRSNRSVGVVRVVERFAWAVHFLYKPKDEGEGGGGGLAHTHPAFLAAIDSGYLVKSPIANR